MQNIIVGKNSVIFGKIILYLEMIYGGNMITSMGLLYILFIGKKSNDRIDYLYGYIKTMVIWTILMYSSLEILSVGNRVTENNVKNFWLITDVILLIIVVLGFIKKRIQIPKIRKKVNRFNVVLAFSLFLIWGISFIMAMRIVPYNWDSLTYHLPRIMHWVQNKSVAHYATNIDRQIASPPLAEFINLHIYLLMGKKDVAFNLLQCMSFGSCIVLTVAIAKKLGCNNFFGFLAGFLYATLPIAFAESITTQNDEYATLWLLFFAYIIIDLYKNPELECDWFYIERTILLSCCIGFGYLAMIIPGISEPPVRTLRATIPENERHIFR